jgi:hypothetical protein
MISKLDRVPEQIPARRLIQRPMLGPDGFVGKLIHLKMPCAIALFIIHTIKKVFAHGTVFQ